MLDVEEGEVIVASDEATSLDFEEDDGMVEEDDRTVTIEGEDTAVKGSKNGVVEGADSTVKGSHWIAEESVVVTCPTRIAMEGINFSLDQTSTFEF